MVWSSKSLTFDQSTPGGPHRLASFDVEGGVPRPLALHLNVYDAESNLEAAVESEVQTLVARQVEIPVLSQVGYDIGHMLVRYGSQAASRTLMCDLRSGTYQLPPSESASIDVVLNATEHPIVVSAAIVEGWVPQPARFTHTFALNIPGPGGWYYAYPDGARWVSLIAAANGTGVGKPRFVFRAHDALQDFAPLIIQDYAAGAFFPSTPGPYELAPLFRTARWVCSNEGTTTGIVAVRFYLES
jgi:hypothetical protein